MSYLYSIKQYKFLQRVDCKENEIEMTRKDISLETKMLVPRRLNVGERQSDIGTALDLSTSPMYMDNFKK